MMARFWKQQSGSAVEFFAVGAVLVAAAALFVGYSAQELARQGDLPTIAFLSPDQYVAKKSRAPSFSASLGVNVTATITCSPPGAATR